MIDIPLSSTTFWNRDKLSDEQYPGIVSNLSIDLIFKAIEIHNNDVFVLTSSMGLIANLGIREEVADKILKYNVFNYIINSFKILNNNFFKNKLDEDEIMTLYDHSIAALSNMSFVKNFLNILLLNEGLENLLLLLKNLKKYLTIYDDNYEIIINILNNLDIHSEYIEKTNSKIYSLHYLIKKYNKIFIDDSNKFLINKLIYKQEDLLNEKPYCLFYSRE